MPPRVVDIWWGNKAEVKGNKAAEELESLKLSFESLSCSFQLELLASAITSLNFVRSNDTSISVMPKPFDWISVPPLCFCPRNFVPIIARSTSVLGYKPILREMEAPTHGLLAITNFFERVLFVGEELQLAPAFLTLGLM